MTKNIAEDDEAIKIFTMKLKGKRNKEIAAELGIHPSTVSTKLKKIRDALKDIDVKVESGEIKLPMTTKAQQQQQTTALALPTQNPFDQLNSFNEMAGIATAGGSVLGCGVASLVRGFQDESIPYEERVMHVMKGGSVVAGGLLSLWLTVKQFNDAMEKAQKPAMKDVTPEAPAAE